MRNNNPLNVPKNGARWSGAKPTSAQTDPDYVKFHSLDYGYRAAWLLIDSIRLRLMEGMDGYPPDTPFTLRHLVNCLYSSGRGDNVEAILKRVSKAMKMGPDHPLNDPAKDTDGQLHDLLFYLTFENCNFSDTRLVVSSINKSWEMAFHVTE